MTFVVIPAGTYRLGSDDARVRLSRPLAVLDREITRRQFVQAIDYDFTRFEGWEPKSGFDEAMVGANWYEAVGFCRWLTVAAGFEEQEQCYPARESLDPQKYPASPLDMAEGEPVNWPMAGLDRRGFRLPSEAEWEVACRAGTQSRWSFGNDEALLSRYGWYLNNSWNDLHPPRMLRPNLWGLFDLHGHAAEWCYDPYASHRVYLRTGAEDIPVDPFGPAMGGERVRRGGAWNSPAESCGSGSREKAKLAAWQRLPDTGFRVVTFPVPDADSPEDAGESANDKNP